MKRQPLIIIGIDGLEPSLVQNWVPRLKNFAQIINQGGGFSLKSVFPPDSIPAWASIFTGKNPARHGILQYINYLSSKELKVDNTSLAGQTFWDMAGSADKKVCIINPFMAYPAWQVNGVMISGPVFIKGAIRSYPATLLNDYANLPVFGGINDFPAKDELSDFIERTAQNVKALEKIGLELFTRDDYDLSFITFLELDRVQHFLWRSHDADDLTHPGDNAFKDTVEDFYRLFDRVLGNFLELARKKGAALMIFSDHGHKRRCTQVFNINELLRRRGYLNSLGPDKKINPLILMEKLKIMVTEFVCQHDLEDLFYKITPYIPYRKELKKSSFLTKDDNNLAKADPDFGGTNPFGGIRIYKEQIGQKNYEEFREQLINELYGTGGGQPNNNIFKWIRKREEIYSGPKIGLYPDILYELRDEYGTNWNLHCPLEGINTTHKKISGGHSQYGGLYLANLQRPVKNSSPGLLNLAPTILDILDIKMENQFEVESILA